MVLSDSRRVSAWALAILVLVSGSLTAFFLRARERVTAHQVQSKRPSWAEVTRLFEDKAFVQLLAAGVIAAVGRTMNAALALMYYRFVLQLSEAQVTQAIFPVFNSSIVISIPLWIALYKR